jgi:hypothetical protein
MAQGSQRENQYVFLRALASLPENVLLSSSPSGHQTNKSSRKRQVAKKNWFVPGECACARFADFTAASRISPWSSYVAAPLSGSRGAGNVFLGI